MSDLRVTIEAGQALPAELVDQLTEHLTCAVADLGLRGRALVHTATAALPDRATKVTINDGPGFVLGAVDTWDTVATALHEFRWAWLSSRTAAEIGADMAAGAKPGLFHQVACQLIRRGFAVHHLDEVHWARDGSASDTAETVMAAQTVRLGLRRQDESPITGVEDWLWEEFGLIIPAVQVRPGQDQAVLNDLRVPGVEEPAQAHNVQAMAQRYAGSLLTAQIVEFLLVQLADVFPQVTSAARRLWSAERLTSALRSLLDDGIPITDMRAVLEALLEAYPDGAPDPHSTDIVSGVRPYLGLTAIRRHLTNGVLPVCRIKTDRPSAHEALSEAATAALHEDVLASGMSPNTLLLTDPVTAPLVRSAIRPRFPGLRVVIPAELPAGVKTTTEHELRLR